MTQTSDAPRSHTRPRAAKALAATLLAGAALLAAAGLILRMKSPLPLLGQVPDFSLTDQAARPFGSSDLRGKPWVVDFVFTSCAGQCMTLTGRMAALQGRLPAGTTLVSLSVDPGRDTPAALARYAQANGAGPDWRFLTGEKAAVERLVKEGFKLPILPGTDPKEPIAHSSRFVLVDGEGRIRGYYDAFEDGALDRLVADAGTL